MQAVRARTREHHDLVLLGADAQELQVVLVQDVRFSDATERALSRCVGSTHLRVEVSHERARHCC
jgi:hypothetical protein